MLISETYRTPKGEVLAVKAGAVYRRKGGFIARWVWDVALTRGGGKTHSWLGYTFFKATAQKKMEKIFNMIEVQKIYEHFD